jgi:glutaminyl-tRNA synthetase
LPCEVRLYEHLFTKPNPDDVEEDGHFLDNLNPNSLEVLQSVIEPSVWGASAGAQYQFERTGYFTVDPDSTPAKLVFNRAVGLKDSYAKAEKGQ